MYVMQITEDAAESVSPQIYRFCNFLHFIFKSTVNNDKITDKCLRNLLQSTKLIRRIGARLRFVCRLKEDAGRAMTPTYNGAANTRIYNPYHTTDIVPLIMSDYVRFLRFRMLQIYITNENSW